MADHIHDRYLWLGFGVFLLVAAKAVYYVVSDISELMGLDDQDDDLPQTPQTEDAISVDILRTLIASPIPSIAGSATSITISRFAQQPDAFRRVREDICSADAALSQRARDAYDMMLPYARSLEPAPVPTLPSTPPGESEAFRIPPWELMRAWSRHSSFDVSEDSWSGHDSESPDGAFVPSPDNPDTIVWTPVLREQPDAQELRVRRRRREAMLLHEGDGSVVESDIIRPRRG